MWRSRARRRSDCRAQRIYLEKPERRETALDAIACRAQGGLSRRTARGRARRLNRILPLVETPRGGIPRARRRRACPAVRARNRHRVAAEHRFSRRNDCRAFALIRELRIASSASVISTCSHRRLRDDQGQAGRNGDRRGQDAHRTFAGTAAWPAFVHVITVNEYLVHRDAEQTRPLYETLGLSVGVVRRQSTQERRAAYACDMVFCTNRDLVFDYLRDRMALGQSAGDLRLKIEALPGRRRGLSSCSCAACISLSSTRPTAC